MSRLLRAAAALTIVTAGACSRPESPADGVQEADSAQSLPKVRYEPSVVRTAAPGVDVTSAPGVAFNYRYAFRLPTNRISAVQEAHAQACEKLGIDRCRIIGMRYRLVNQRDIQAMLALRLDPKLARAFGKQASETVARSDGMLVDLEITGEDVGSQIKAATRSEAQLRADLAEVERQLAAIRASDPRRGELVARADELRTQIRALSESKAQGAEALAGTPMVFNYGSGNVVPGFDVRSPIRDAIGTAGDNVIRGFAVILLILITLIPWLLLGAAVYWIVGFVRRGWPPGRLGHAGAGPEADGGTGGPAPARRSSRASRGKSADG